MHSPETDIAAPGTTLYYGLNSVRPQFRQTIVGLFSLHNALREVMLSGSEVSTIKLAWWHEEIDRLLHGNPRHPVTKSIATVTMPALDCLRSWIPGLQPFFAKTTFSDENELMNFGSALCLPLFSAVSAASNPTPTPSYMNENLRQLAVSYSLFDFTQNIREYLNGDVLPVAQSDINLEHLVSPESFQLIDQSARVQVLKRQHNRATRAVDKTLSSEATTKSHCLQLGKTISEIQRKTLQEIKRSGYDTSRRHIDLTPLRKAWISWRANRFLTR